jgi:hypothetical protein
VHYIGERIAQGLVVFRFDFHLISLQKVDCVWLIGDERLLVYVEFYLCGAVFVAVQNERLELQVVATAEVCVD